MTEKIQYINQLFSDMVGGVKQMKKYGQPCKEMLHKAILLFLASVSYVKFRVLKLYITPRVDRGYPFLFLEIALCTYFYRYVFNLYSKHDINTYNSELFLNTIFYQTVCTTNKTISKFYKTKTIEEWDEQLDTFEYTIYALSTSLCYLNKRILFSRFYFVWSYYLLACYPEA